MVVTLVAVLVFLCALGGLVTGSVAARTTHRRERKLARVLHWLAGALLIAGSAVIVAIYVAWLAAGLVLVALVVGVILWVLQRGPERT